MPDSGACARGRAVPESGPQILVYGVKHPQEAMYMIGLAFFLIGAAIAAGFIVLGWKMACKAQEQDEKKNPK